MYLCPVRSLVKEGTADTNWWKQKHKKTKKGAKKCIWVVGHIDQPQGFLSDTVAVIAKWLHQGVQSGSILEGLQEKGGKMDIITSKTFWFNVITGLLTLLNQFGGTFHIDPVWIALIAAIANAIIKIFNLQALTLLKNELERCRLCVANHNISSRQYPMLKSKDRSSKGTRH